MRPRHHGRVPHPRQAPQHLLDLGRVDVLAAAHDPVVQPAGDGQTAVLGDPAQVTGAVPALVQGFGGLLGAVVVAEHDAGAAYPDLALAVGAVLSGLRIDQPDFGAGERRPAAAGCPVAVRRLHGDLAAGLGAAVAVEERGAEPRLDLLPQLRFAGRAGGDTEPQRGDRAQAGVEQLPVGERHSAQHGRLVLLDEPEQCGRFRCRGDPCARAGHRSAQDAQRVGVGVRERQRPQQPVRRRQTESRQVAGDRGPQRGTLAGHRGPGGARGAGRVEQPCRFVQAEIVGRRGGRAGGELLEPSGVRRRAPALVRAAPGHDQPDRPARRQPDDPRQVPPVGDEYRRIAVGQQVREFGVGAARTQRHTDRRGTHGGEETLDQLHAVVQTEGHPGTAADRQPRRQPGRTALQFGPAHCPPVIGERGLLAMP
ncbi:hypothetical protein SCHAM137S_06008 [Streptomyces chartreusis]